MPSKPPIHRPRHAASPKPVRRQADRLYDRKRGSSTQRGYGARWQRRRLIFLKNNPLCVECLKRGERTPATEVDHIEPHNGDPVLFWDESNWQGLCKTDHSIKTRTRDARSARARP